MMTPGDRRTLGRAALTASLGPDRRAAEITLVAGEHDQREVRSPGGCRVTCSYW